MEELQATDLIANLAELRNNAKYSDLQIKSHGETFKVHRIVVCSQSAVLDRECNGDFSEACNGTIEHTMFDSITMDRMLKFMYSGCYDVDAHADAPMASVLVAHVHVCAIAEYYDVTRLKDLAAENFKAAARDFEVERFIEVVQAVHQHTPAVDTGIRPLLSALTVEHLDHLLDDNDFVNAISHEENGLHTYLIDLLRAANVRYEQSSRGHNEDRTNAEAYANHLGARHEEAQEYRKTLQKELSLMQQVLARAVELVNGTAACKKCGKCFAAELEKESQLCRSNNTVTSTRFVVRLVGKVMRLLNTAGQ
ncbi:hypothetical protein LTR33_002695 [Friedmanniomyces endolithicus]|nr:hypothetical protein LTR33_002695 [Friedmanniomyces endolithicus]